jgi:hypothetical protein
LGEDLREAGGLGLKLILVTLRNVVNMSRRRNHAELTHSKKKRHVRILGYTRSPSPSNDHDRSEIEFTFIVNLADQVVITTLDADRGILDEPLQDALRIFEGLVAYHHRGQSAAMVNYARSQLSERNPNMRLGF